MLRLHWRPALRRRSLRLHWRPALRRRSLRLHWRPVRRKMKLGLQKSTAAAKSKSSSITSTKVTYTFKTAAEKKAALLGAMESWIKGMMTNLSSSTATHCIKQWDVINEPITDGTYKWRGVDGNFSDDDTAPTEDQTNGLTMDWARGQ